MRYERQLLMPQIGKKGQKRLGQSTVKVIGTGGLGSPVLTYGRMLNYDGLSIT